MGPTHRCRPALVALLCAAAIVLGGCRSLGYYAHVAHGQLALMESRQPVAAVVADPSTPEALRRTLLQMEDARGFASAQLGLPDNGSYTSYVDLGRPYVTWNVFAAPEFSVAPVHHCFPVAGCVAYRGYFSPDKATQEASRLASKGYETYIGGASAYSTLGWFDDPIPSSMLAPGQDDPVGVMFHELAHQALYVPGDTAFNESLATFVQREGLREWRSARHEPPPDETLDRHEAGFTRRALQLRDDLARLYVETLPPTTMREEKARRIERFRQWYARRRDDDWRADARFDAWMAGPIDNAKLAPLGLYDEWVPAFAALFEQVGGDWQRFHHETRAIAGLAARKRHARLEALMP